MSNRLDSIEAVRDFKLECLGNDYKVTANVKVFSTNDYENTLHDVKVDVHVELDTNYHKVSIWWEQELGENWKQVDGHLYGIYSTDYYGMSYNYKELTIHSEDITIIIRV